MEEDFFDVAVEGTTVNDLQQISEECRKIVIDWEDNYGSTYTSLKKLARSHYIDDVRILKAPDDRVTVEALPFLLRPSHPAVKAYSSKPFGGRIEYVEIRNVLFVDGRGRAVRLPTSKTDVVNMDCLGTAGRFYMHEAIKTGNVAAFKEYLARSCSEDDPLYRAFVTHSLFAGASFPTLGASPYVYPVHGSSEISENISLTNSLRGYSYLLNRGTAVSEVDRNGYNYRFECEFGTLYTKQFVRQKLARKPHHVRMLQITEPLHGGNFLGYLESEEIIRVIGLDDRTKTCPCGMQTLYFVKAAGPITQAEIDTFVGPSADVRVDLSFRTIFDPNQFEDHRAGC